MACNLTTSIVLACGIIAAVSLGFAGLALATARVCDAIRDHNLRMMRVYLRGRR